MSSPIRSRDFDFWLAFAGAVALRRGSRLPALEESAPKLTVNARVDHGRWLADCPFCRGAEEVDREHPLFLCLSCWNEPVGGRWVRVIFPRHWQLIERELSKRPEEPTQNWYPGETVADLRRENAEHAIGVSLT